MADVEIKLSEDAVIILFEFFERFERKERLYFVHQAEYLALMKLAGQLEHPTMELINTDKNKDKSFEKIVAEARKRLAVGFESDFPKLELE